MKSRAGQQAISLCALDWRPQSGLSKLLGLLAGWLAGEPSWPGRSSWGAHLTSFGVPAAQPDVDYVPEERRTSERLKNSRASALSAAAAVEPSEAARGRGGGSSESTSWRRADIAAQTWGRSTASPGLPGRGLDSTRLDSTRPGCRSRPGGPGGSRGLRASARAGCPSKRARTN